MRLGLISVVRNTGGPIALQTISNYRMPMSLRELKFRLDGIVRCHLCLVCEHGEPLMEIFDGTVHV